MKRKDFIKTTAIAGAGAAVMPGLILGNSPPQTHINLGFIGTGLRGQWLLDLAAKREDVNIPAICDIDGEMIQYAQKILQNNNKSPGERILN